MTYESAVLLNMNVPLYVKSWAHKVNDPMDDLDRKTAVALLNCNRTWPHFDKLDNPGFILSQPTLGISEWGEIQQFVDALK